MDEQERITARIDVLKALISKVEPGMSAIPEQQKNAQAAALRLLVEETAQLTAKLATPTPTVSVQSLV